MNSVNSCKERNGDFGQGLKEKVPTASALHLGSSFKGASYSVCNTQNHKTEKCYVLLKLKGTQRLMKRKGAELSFQCLSRGSIVILCDIRKM